MERNGGGILANMVTGRSQFSENQPPAGKATVHDPELIARVFDAFFEMRELLEDHAPSWYSEALHEKAEVLRRDLEKWAFACISKTYPVNSVTSSRYPDFT